jgi:hypothetical protein
VVLSSVDSGGGTVSDAGGNNFENISWRGALNISCTAVYPVTEVTVLFENISTWGISSGLNESGTELAFDSSIQNDTQMHNNILVV